MKFIILAAVVSTAFIHLIHLFISTTGAVYRD